MILCSACSKALGKSEGTPAVASISGSIMGDEISETYFFCAACGLFTVEVCHDRFCGEETVSFRGPIAEAEGSSKVELIRRCPEPWDKKCRCPAHREYYGDWLD